MNLHRFDSVSSEHCECVRDFFFFFFSIIFFRTHMRNSIILNDMPTWMNRWYIVPKRFSRNCTTWDKNKGMRCNGCSWNRFGIWLSHKSSPLNWPLAYARKPKSCPIRKSKCEREGVRTLLSIVWRSSFVPAFGCSFCCYGRQKSKESLLTTHSTHTYMPRFVYGNRYGAAFGHRNSKWHSKRRRSYFWPIWLTYQFWNALAYWGIFGAGFGINQSWSTLSLRSRILIIFIVIIHLRPSLRHPCLIVDHRRPFLVICVKNHSVLLP